MFNDFEIGQIYSSITNTIFNKKTIFYNKLKEHIHKQTLKESLNKKI